MSECVSVSVSVSVCVCARGEVEEGRVNLVSATAYTCMIIIMFSLVPRPNRVEKGHGFHWVCMYMHVISLLLPSIGSRYEAKSRSDLNQRCVAKSRSDLYQRCVAKSRSDLNQRCVAKSRSDLYQRCVAKSCSDLYQRCVLFVCEVPGQQLHTVDSSLPSQDVGGVIFSHAHHCTKQFHQSSILSIHTHTHTHTLIANLES